MNHIHRLLLLILITLCVTTGRAQERTVNNVILMIPDGTSSALLSLSRWYQYYLDSSQHSLALDPYLCGMLITHSSDAPIGDSAPTTSCYVTGIPSQTSSVSSYPVKTDHDLFPIDALRAYQPLATLLEGAKILKGKATGLVFTCEFPHATPADCAAHSYNRTNYNSIASQMIHNNVDVVIGGGTKYLTNDLKNDLLNDGYAVILNDKNKLCACREKKIWALFADKDMPYELERDTNLYPSLAAMTDKALTTLSANENGFFLMVEGSKVDWAAHENDAKTAMIEFLAFDKAVKVALDFAARDGHTVVIIAPDHGTGGLNMGNTHSNNDYDRLSLKQIMQPVDSFMLSTYSAAEMIKQHKREEMPLIVSRYYHLDLSPAEIDYLYAAKDFKDSPVSEEERKRNLSLSKMLAQLLYSKTYFGFTTFGHTGENVFLAAYHPNNDVPHGVLTNVQLHRYLCKQLGIENQLPALTDSLFVSHKQLFADARKITVDSLGNDCYRLSVWFNDKKKLVAENSKNYVMINDKKVPLSSVIVYVDKNGTFYLPASLINNR